MNKSYLKIQVAGSDIVDNKSYLGGKRDPERRLDNSEGYLPGPAAEGKCLDNFLFWVGGVRDCDNFFNSKESEINSQIGELERYINGLTRKVVKGKYVYFYFWDGDKQICKGNEEWFELEKERIDSQVKALRADFQAFKKLFKSFISDSYEGHLIASVRVVDFLKDWNLSRCDFVPVSTIFRLTGYLQNELPGGLRLDNSGVADE